MKLKKINFGKRYLLIFAVIAFMLPVAIFPDRYVSSIAGGLNLYAISVLPALFPFFFFSKILAELNFGYDLGLTLRKPLKKCFNAPALSGYVLVMSMLCGYPVGAKLTADFYEKGLINLSESKTIAAFTSTSGPLFVVGTVGVAMLGSKQAGFIILISHYLSALINGFIFRSKKSESVALPAVPNIKYDKVLSESMLSSIASVAIVGGYIAVFNMVLDLFFDLGIISLFARPLSFLGLNIRLGEGLAASFVEITKGCLMLSQSGFGLKITAPLCALGITFGGLSVTLQSLTFLTKCKISPAFYLLSKTVQGIIAFLICLGLSYLLL